MGVYKKGDNWYIDFYVEGNRKRKMIGPSKQLAKLALKDAQIKVAKGEYLGIYEEKKVLFRDFAEKYLTYCLTNHSPETYHQEKICIKSNLVRALGDKYLFNLSPQDVEKYKATRQEMGTKASTINRELDLLKAIVNKAVEWKYLQRNPIASVKALKEAKPFPRFLSPKEVESLLTAAASSYIYPIIVVALNTGMRRGELLSLEWKDIDFENRVIYVDNKPGSGHHVKNYEPRAIPMNEEVYETLKAIEPRSNYVFCHQDGNRYKQPYGTFRNALKRAGIENFRLHDLRHTFASNLVMNGVDIRTVQRLLGHKSIQMTMRYSHLSQSHLQNAVKNIYYRHSVDTNEEESEETLVNP